MKRKLFNITVYMMLAYSLVNAGYIALPIEYQEMIPQYNNLVAFISASATGLMGIGGLAVQTFIDRAKTDADGKFNLLASNYLNVEKAYHELKETFNLRDVKLEAKYTELLKSVIRNNELLKVDLEAKLSNPLIDVKIKELIESVMNDE